MTRRGVPGDRAQSHVVGVAVMLGVTVVALGTVTASLGAVVQGSAAAADANRVAADLDDALRPVEATGHRRGEVSFTSGELVVVERELRILDGAGVVETVPVDALVFRAGEQRVVYLAGAVVRSTGSGAHLHARPPIAASEGVMVVGAPRLNASDRRVATTEPTTVALETNVSHRRQALGDGEYRVAMETTTPGAWERYFERAGATTTRRDLDGDGVDSVVGTFPGVRTGYLVVHDLRLEVRPRG